VNPLSHRTLCISPFMTLPLGEKRYGKSRCQSALKNVGSVTGSELATYVVEEGKPLVALVK
jgi:hypothetical protein